MMKKLFAVLATVLTVVPMIEAQESVTGVVVDKNGNPIPGVRIEIPGTPDQTISGLDGTFTISSSNPKKNKVVASYAGMGQRKMKLKDGMKIKMSEYNWWSQKPDSWNWLVEAIVAIPNSPKVSGEESTMNPAFGLMLGRVKNFGYYVKGVTNTFGGDSEDLNNNFSGIIQKQRSSYWSISGGGIIRLGCPIHFYAGAGFASYRYRIQDISGEWYNDYERAHDNFVIDFGFMLRIKRLTISLGSCLAPMVDYYHYSGDTYHECKAAGNFGIGYSF